MHTDYQLDGAMRLDIDAINCPLCDTPHRRLAVTCDGCGQLLAEPLNLDALRDDRASQKRNVAIATVALIALLALNIALFGGAAYLITTAPLGWLIWSWIRFRALSRRLERVARR